MRKFGIRKNNKLGYDHGAEHASQAIDYANDLEVPDGTALFGDIEPKFPVDSAFLEG